MTEKNAPDSRLAAIFDEAIAARAFPGGVVWLAHDDTLHAHAAWGTTAYEAEYSCAATTQTIYDIASVSKLFTMTVALICAREAGIAIETPIKRFLPDWKPPANSAAHDITVRQLLHHTSGIEIAIQSFAPRPTIECHAVAANHHALATSDWISRIAQSPLHAAPGERVLYSCTNYFLLGRLVEAWSKISLDENIENRLLQPLGMNNTSFHPLEKWSLEQIAPAEIDEDTGRPWHGVAHDEAARAWMASEGSACGNSGLFSSASDLARFARLWLDEGQWNGEQIINGEDVRRALNDTVRAATYNQGLGWHQDVSSWMSLRAPRGTAGHAGFTGPTLFLCPSTRHVAIMLDNRVYPTRHGPVRMRFHRQVAQWLFERDGHDQGE